MSPSPRRLGDLKNKKQNSLESNTSVASTTAEIESTKLHENTTTNGNTNGTNSTADNGGKFENISDNGSEISDEGYRSLGLIQQGNTNQSKRTSLHSQTSIEDGKIDDAKTNGRFLHLFLFHCHVQQTYFFFLYFHLKT